MSDNGETPVDLISQPTEAVAAALQCYCEIEYEGDHYQPAWYIDYCLLHAAAPELLEAIKSAKRFLMVKARRDKEERKIVS